MTTEESPASPVVDLTVFRDQVVAEKLKEEMEKLPVNPTGSQLFSAILRVFPQNSPLTW